MTNHDALEPVLHDLTPDQKITILLAAYNKHATALGAIESSQQSLVNLILGIYSVALTLLIALYKDERDLLQSPNAFLGLSSLDWVMIAAALSVAVYAFFMSTGRNKARMSVRQAVTRIDSAFGFFEKGVFLKNETLYPSSFAPYARTSFLQYAHYLLYAPAVAFVAGVLIFSRG